MNAQRIRVWFSSEDGKRYKLDRQQDLEAVATEGEEAAQSRRMTAIQVDPSITYQSILGMGSSLEEATVYHLTRMSEEIRERVLRDMVDPEEGIGWNLFRICFGTSDFTSQAYYSYDDMPAASTDVNLEHFSIQKDIDCNIIGVIKEALEYNPDIKIFASPWSPPGWMKSSGSMCGGRLLPEHYEVAARYYRKAIQAYEEQGIPIYAFTLQNEPLMIHRGYPTCYIGWEEQNVFLKKVKAEFERHNIKAKIWVFDHNFKDAMTYPARILQDAESYAAVDGVAVHDYEGSPSEMTALHDAFPKKDLFLTERSNFRARGIDRILQYFRNWAKSYSAWVTCLDDRQQPNPGPHHCSPTFVMVNRNDANDYQYIPEYYLLGQVSKFVKRGARRIGSNYGSRRTVTNAAFLNPDGTTVLIVVNQTSKEQHFTIVFPGAQVSTAVPSKTVATYEW